MANSSRPARMSSRPPQNGRVRRQFRQRWRRVGRRAGAGTAGFGPGPASGTVPASSAVMASAAPAKAKAQVWQGERARGGVPGVLDQVVDGDLVSLLTEGP